MENKIIQNEDGVSMKITDPELIKLCVSLNKAKGQKDISYSDMLNEAHNCINILMSVSSSLGNHQIDKLIECIDNTSLDLSEKKMIVDAFQQLKDNPFKDVKRISAAFNIEFALSLYKMSHLN